MYPFVGHMYDRVKSSSSEILGGNDPTSKDIKKAKKVSEVNFSFWY
jgi:hypothetical protein